MRTRRRCWPPATPAPTPSTRPAAQRFVDLLTAAGATRSAARAIYARATQAHATTLALLGNYNSAFTSVAPSAVAQPLAAADAAADAGQLPEPAIAVWRQRLLLVRALPLDPRSGGLPRRHPAVPEDSARRASGTARDVLFARRPDLGAIELSCDNTNGVVPYIDLVCEVLEDAVSAPSQDTVRARQTSGSPEELRANPRFVNEAAYTTLRNAVFPHAAPFDLWTAEVRAFLRQLGVPWHDLLAAFQVPAVGTTPASPTDTQIAGERLGFNASALTLVTTAAPAQPWTHWGLQENNNTVPDPRKPNDPTAVVTGTWLQVLAFVPILLHRADLRHRELVQLLATRFINPNGAIKIVETRYGRVRELRHRQADDRDLDRRRAVAVQSVRPAVAPARLHDLGPRQGVDHGERGQQRDRRHGDRAARALRRRSPPASACRGTSC